MKKTFSAKNLGFGAFPVLIVATLIIIAGVVGYVMISKLSKKEVAALPLSPAASATPTVTPQPTPQPTVSTSSDVDIIGKEINETKIESVEPEFTSLNSSAASL